MQQTISLIPVWLENGSVQKQTWSMQGVYLEPEQSFDTGVVEVYQLTQQTSDSEKNKAFRFSAYLNGLFEGNGEVFDPDNFKVESEQPASSGFIVVETLTQQFHVTKCDTEDEAAARVIAALGDDGGLLRKRNFGFLLDNPLSRYNVTTLLFVTKGAFTLYFESQGCPL